MWRSSSGPMLLKTMSFLLKIQLNLNCNFVLGFDNENFNSRSAHIHSRVNSCLAPYVQKVSASNANWRRVWAEMLAKWKEEKEWPCRLFFARHNHSESKVPLPAHWANVGAQQEGLSLVFASVKAVEPSTLLLQLKKSLSINDECQTQHDVWDTEPTSIWYRFMGTAGQETQDDTVENM